ncbi:hypothetical protein Tco_0829647 [Tanacetum coccineum]
MEDSVCGVFQYWGTNRADGSDDMGPTIFNIVGGDGYLCLPDAQQLSSLPPIMVCGVGAAGVVHDEMLFINENSQIRVVNEVYKLHILHEFYKGNICSVDRVRSNIDPLEEYTDNHIWQPVADSSSTLPNTFGFKIQDKRGCALWYPEKALHNGELTMISFNARYVDLSQAKTADSIDQMEDGLGFSGLVFSVRVNHDFRVHFGESNDGADKPFILTVRLLALAIRVLLPLLYYAMRWTVIQQPFSIQGDAAIGLTLAQTVWDSLLFLLQVLVKASNGLWAAPVEPSRVKFQLRSDPQTEMATVLIPKMTFVGVESKVLIPETNVWDTLVYPSDLVIRKQNLE